MNRALLSITPDMLRERLMLPAGTVIDGATWDPRVRTIVLSVVHPDFPDVPDFHHAPEARIEVRWLP